MASLPTAPSSSFTPFHASPKLQYVPFDSKIEELTKTVIDGGYCIGCGACAAIEGSPFRVAFDAKGRYQARDVEHAEPSVDPCSVCPFADGNPNDDELSKSLFADSCTFDKEIGYYKGIYGGCVSDEHSRLERTSGGFSQWLLRTLLAEGLVDGIAHVVPSGDSNALFHYTISRTPEELTHSAKSAYYPVEMSSILKQIAEQEGRYAIVAVPSFIRGLRLLSKNEPVFAERIRFCIGIISGHLKSKHYAELLASQFNIPAESMRHIDFRKKRPGRPANFHATEITVDDGLGGTQQYSAPSSHLFGANWGHGFMKYLADDYSDDVIGETADVSIGDAWLPRYVKDSRGDNIVVVRNPTIATLIAKGMKHKELTFDELTPKDVVRSQGPGYRHRREGLACRAGAKKAAGKWYPPSRVPLDVSRVSPTRIQLYLEREELAMKSHDAFIGSTSVPHAFVKFATAMFLPAVRYSLLLNGKTKILTIGQLCLSLLCYFGRPKFHGRKIVANG